ncbi:hypothetical protein M3649_21175 [Ureibacillus chungkukjangi]|uniref:hypothetical protein n=1 Tax=Ureibacillus chungkukjangi TaxID=1202712 RepID=UPI00203DC47A|nr:hypothetical protein [Ureibacillus chungkukjangi]MCM3390599.1 hypothetical protein [Ureibacillus chungkukjangi]
MGNQDHILEELKELVKDLVKTSNMLIQSNQSVIQSNQEIKQLLLQKDLISVLDIEASNTLNTEFTPPPAISKGTDENINAELFKKIVNVYYYEEIERIKSNNVRKSARRVSVELGKTMVDFLYQHLKDTGLSFKRFPDGLILITSEEKWIGAIKIISDLGFHRGEQWNKYVEEIVEHCNTKYDLNNRNIYFVISSLRNGLEQGHVAKLLDREIRSNWEFMNNRTLVDEYVKKFIRLTTCLETPNKQIYIMGSEIHPNVIADDLHKMNEEQYIDAYNQIDQYDWICDLKEFLDELRHLS